MCWSRLNDNAYSSSGKLQGNQGLNEMTVRPIIFNTGTASYETAKYLNNLLSPLGKSQHTVPNSKEFVEKIKE